MEAIICLAPPPFHTHTYTPTQGFSAPFVSKQSDESNRAQEIHMGTMNSRNLDLQRGWTTCMAPAPSDSG